MLSFRQGFRAFREGLDWRLIRDYWKAVREHAWETFWGAGVPGIAFTIYTLWHAPARPYIPWAVAWAMLVAGYFIWRADHVRLIPKLIIGDIHMIYTSMGIPIHKARFVQFWVSCATEGALENCRGKLLRISRWNDGQWEPTHIDEPLDLLWSYVDEPTIKLEVPTCLNVFAVENTSRHIVIWTPARITLGRTLSDCLKFDVWIKADHCLEAYVSLKVTFGDQWDHWDDLTAEIIGHEQ